MKNKKAITILVIAIAVLSAGVNIAGLFWQAGEGVQEFTAISGEKVEIYGQGLYKNDSLSVVAQGKAGDLITLVLGVPLLLISLYFARKSSFGGRLLLTGTLGYFLYTYVSYVFLWSYNQLFLVYVALMGASLYAFILAMMSFDIDNIKDRFTEKYPRKIIAGFQIFIAVALAFMWLGRIFAGAVPIGLEHYTTLVIQALDLGLVLPTAVVSAVLLLKRKPYGYLLSSVIVMKAITMLTAVFTMGINEVLSGLTVNFGEFAVFGIMLIFSVGCMVLILKNIKA